MNNKKGLRNSILLNLKIYINTQINLDPLPYALTIDRHVKYQRYLTYI